MAQDNHGVAQIGRSAVIGALERRGAHVKEMREGNLVLLQATKPDAAEHILLRVKPICAISAHI